MASKSNLHWCHLRVLSRPSTEKLRPSAESLIWKKNNILAMMTRLSFRDTLILDVLPVLEFRTNTFPIYVREETFIRRAFHKTNFLILNSNFLMHSRLVTPQLLYRHYLQIFFYWLERFNQYKPDIKTCIFLSINYHNF